MDAPVLESNLILNDECAYGYYRLIFVDYRIPDALFTDVISYFIRRCATALASALVVDIPMQRRRRYGSKDGETTNYFASTSL